MEEKRNRSNTKTRKKGFQFAPFHPEGEGSLLSDLGLAADEELLIFERGGEERGLIMRQMAYHHVAQRKLAGEPYLVSF